MSKKAYVKKVSDVMTPHVFTVQPSTQFKSIVRILRTNRIGAVPVVDASDRVVGVVSETDLLPKEEPVSARSHHLLESKANRELRRKALGLIAADLMTTPAITVSPETSLRDAARTLVEHRISHLPVVDAAEQLVGIVGRSDLLSLFTREDTSLRDEVSKEVVEQTRLLDVAKVEVAVDQGVVTLSGEIDRRSDAQHLVATVQQIDGVVDVINHLRYWWDDSTASPVEEALLSQYYGSGMGRGW
jgi:CBS-domain-containing membrane protein